MGKYVVLVEDDPLLLDVLARLICDLGAQCFKFSTSDDALVHMLKSKEPTHLVIADQTTPGQLKGLDLAQLIQERWPNCPVVVMSGHDQSAFTELPAGVAFFQKPLSIVSLFDLVSEILVA